MRPYLSSVRLKRFAHGYEVSVTIIEDYMMVEYVDLLEGSDTRLFLKKMMNCSCKVDCEHSLLVLIEFLLYTLIM